MKKYVLVLSMVVVSLFASAQRATYLDTLKSLSFEQLDSLFRKTQCEFMHVQKDLIFNSTLESKFVEIGKRLDIISERRKYLLKLRRI